MNKDDIYLNNLHLLVEHFNSIHNRNVKLKVLDDYPPKLVYETLGREFEATRTKKGLYVISIPDNEFENDLGFVFNPYTIKMHQIEYSEYVSRGLRVLDKNNDKPSAFFKHLTPIQIAQVIGTVLVTIGSINFSLGGYNFKLIFFDDSAEISIDHGNGEIEDINMPLN